MTFEQFLAYVRKHIGSYCKDQYWKWKYSTLKDTTEEGIKSEMPYLAIQAIGSDYAYKHSYK